MIFDSLGDLTSFEGRAPYLIQVKATLRKERAPEVAREALAVDAFLAERYPVLREAFRFGVWCRHREGTVEPRELAARDLGLSGAEADRWEELRCRVLPVEIRPDPYLGIVLRLFPLAEDPFGLAEALRGSLLRLLGEDTASDQIALELLRLVSDARRPHEASTPGRLLQPEDFLAAGTASTQILLGDRPRLEDLADGCFMPRGGHVQRVLEVLAPLLSGLGEDASKRALPVVWLDGTSGSGKSVLLLQVLERLVREWDVSVHLLPPSSQRLPEALAFWRRAGLKGLIAVDDVYAPENRQREVWGRVQELSFEENWLAPPIILTCGPSDYRSAFEAEVRRGGGLKLISVPLTELEGDERSDYAAWYAERTGIAVRAISEGNFATVSFLYGLQRDGKPGDLGQFAQRLGDRLENLGVFDEVLTVIVGTSLGFPLPASLFSGKEDARGALLQEDLLRVQSAEEGLQTITFLHPKLARRIFDHLVPRESEYRRVDYLVRCFQAVRSERVRAQAVLHLPEHPNISVRERRLFLERIWEALAEREPPDLELGLIRSWHIVAHSVAPDLAGRVLEQVVTWLSSPKNEEIGTGVLWEIAWDAALPTPSKHLVQQGREWLLRNPDLGPWNHIWQRLWKHSEQDDEMATIAEFWLELEPSHPGWSYVFQALVYSGRKGPELAQIGLEGLRHSPVTMADPYIWIKVLNLGPPLEDFLKTMVMRYCRCRIEKLSKKFADFIEALCEAEENLAFLVEALEEKNSQDLPSWSRCWQGLVTAFTPSVPWKLWAAGRNWLSGREGCAEWNYVWQRLLETAASEAEKEELRALGRSWLSGREDRAEWNYIWQRLLEIASSEEEKKELRELGRSWLLGREDRAEWTFVWRQLFSKEEEESKELRGFGRSWLSGHEDRADWNYVWRRLLETAASEAEKEELRGLGRSWLSSREDRADWNYVWKPLLELTASGEEREKLRELGRSWLPGREDRAAWTHVWEHLLKFAASEEEVEELRSLGRSWLSGREDRADWSYVWEHLLKSAKTKEPGDLYNVGLNWLEGHEKRTEWNFVWRFLAQYYPTDPRLINIARVWLSEERPQAEASPVRSLFSRVSVYRPTPQVVGASGRPERSVGAASGFRG